MKTLIFLYEIVKIRLDLSALYHPENHRMILIAGENCLANLSNTDRWIFDEIYSLDKFTLETVEPIVKKYLTANPAEDLRILNCEEESGLLCAELRQRHNLPGRTTAEVLPFVDKIVMKEKLSNSAVRMPKHIVFDKDSYQKSSVAYINLVEQQIGYPLIIKPTQGSGSVGAFKIVQAQDLKPCLDDLSQDGQEYEIDEFIEGKIYHCDALIRDQKVLFFAAGEYINPCLDFDKGKPAGTLILLETDPLRKRLQQFTEQVTTFLQPPNGMIHLEVFQTLKDELVFLEVGARAPGGYIVPAYYKMYAVNLEILHYQVQLGWPVILPESTAKLYAGVCYFPNKHGIVREIKKPTLQCKHNLQFHVTVGESLKASNGLDGSSGALMYWSENYAALRADFESLRNFDPLVMEGV